MKAFFTEVVAPVASHPDVTLCLRFDSEQDGSLADAQHLVDQLSREHLEDTALLEVVLLSEPMPRNTPQRLGLSVHAWIGDSPSTAFVKAVGAPVFATPQPVLAAWSTLREELHGWDAPTTQ